MTWTSLFLPVALLFSRVGAFVMASPLTGSDQIPRRIRAALAILLSIFLVWNVDLNFDASKTHWLGGLLLMVSEMIWGVALGLALRLVFLSVSQGGRMAGRAMGLEMAQIMDPNSSENSQPVALIFEMVFMVLFLSAGGMKILLEVIYHSYSAFPVGDVPNTGGMAEMILASGTAMLEFGLKLAGPILAGGLLLSVVLGILARILPEMNILFMSLPMRVAVGLIIAISLIPLFDEFTVEIAKWMTGKLVL